MNVFLAGATGALGRRLIPSLVGRGHAVTGLARSEEKAEQVRALGGTPAEADLFDADALARAAEGADVIIHAATAIPTGRAARSREGWAANDRIRTEGTRALIEAATRVGARRFLFQSIVMVVGGRGKEARDESWPPDPPELGRTAAEAEGIAREAGDHYGFQVGILRGGMFYGPDTADSRGMAELLREGKLPVPGKGDRPVSPIRVSDMARAFALAAASERDGTWHIVDDEPVPFARFLAEFAAAVGGPEPRHVPRLMARSALGRHRLEAIYTSTRSPNRRAREELGWAPEYPTYREGIAQMVEEWRDPRPSS